MGIRIFCADETAPYPRPVALELCCDEVEAHGLFPPEPQRFDCDGDFITQHAAAMKTGWLERNTDDGRKWLGPCCSGKKAC